MTPDLAEKWAAHLHALRTGGAAPDSSGLAAPQTVEEAYAIQSKAGLLDPDGVRGWKVTALSPDAQESLMTDRAAAGPLFAAHVHADKVTLGRAQYRDPLIECEIAFLLATDLPPRLTPYTREDMVAHVAAIVPLFEIVDTRCTADASRLLRLADSLDNGAVVVGQPVANWQDIRLDDITITLSHDGKPCAQGNAAAILGDPLMALVAIANAQPLSCGGLKAGQVVTTGTCTLPEPVSPGTYVGAFGPLGTVTCTLA